VRYRSNRLFANDSADYLTDKLETTICNYYELVTECKTRRTRNAFDVMYDAIFLFVPLINALRGLIL